MIRDSGWGMGSSVTPMVRRLLAANGIAFLVTLLIGERLIFDAFGLQPGRIFVRPWGVFTYMFVHAGFWHLAMNMLVLFFFGPPLEARWGGREFLRFYVIAGLGGAALSFFFPGATVIGASGAVYGVMLAFAMNWPNAPIYVYGIVPVKAKWLVAGLFVLTVLSMPGSAGGGTAHFAHLGGLLAAFVYLKSDWRLGAAFSRIRRSGGGGGTTGPRREPRRLAIVPRELTQTSASAASTPPADAAKGDSGQADTASRAAPRSGAPAPSADERRLLDEVDRVLDKISAQGMASLTREERELLDEVSRRRRSN